MKEIELAALLVSRVCHDLISPVGALSNGVEVLSDEDDPVMRDHAIALISKSAEQAAAKLKLCRLAYGSMGSAGDEVSLGDVQDALAAFLKDSKIKLDWRAQPMLVGKDIAKFVINLGMSAMDTIPRGGVLKISAERTGSEIAVSASGDGPMARVTDDLTNALAGTFQMSELDGRRIQPFLTGLIGRSLGCAPVEIVQDGGIMTLRVSVPLPSGAVAAA